MAENSEDKTEVVEDEIKNEQVENPEVEEEVSDEEAAMMAEWEAMSGEDDTSNKQETNNKNPLSQDEIDNLFGMENKSSDDDKSPLQKLINSRLVQYERLPMLEVVFDRLARELTTNLRNLTSDNVDINISNIKNIRFNDYMEKIPLPSLLEVFHSPELDGYGLITLNTDLIYATVDSLLGGGKSKSVPIDGRHFTPIEQNLSVKLIKEILNSLTEAFTSVRELTFTHERLETNPKFASITQGNNASIYIEVEVEIDERRGKFELLFPNATIEPIREELRRQFRGEKAGRDSLWENHLAKLIPITQTNLICIIGKKKMNMEELLNLKKGDRIELNSSISDLVGLYGPSSKENELGPLLYEGRIGQKDKNIVYKIYSTESEDLKDKEYLKTLIETGEPE